MARQDPGTRRNSPIGAIAVVLLLVAAVAAVRWSLNDATTDDTHAEEPASLKSGDKSLAARRPGSPAGTASPERVRKRAEVPAAGPQDEPLTTAPGRPTKPSPDGPPKAGEFVQRVRLAGRAQQKSSGADPVEVSVSVGVKTARALGEEVRFADLPPGDYDVTTSAPGYVTLREAVSVPAHPDQHSTIFKAIRFTVRVKTGEGVVVADAPVDVIPFTLDRQRPPIRRRTTSDGVAEFDNVPEGRASIWAHTGFAAGIPTPLEIRSDVWLADGRSIDIVTTNVSGAEVRGTVVDAGGVPISGARVVVLDDGGTPRNIFADAETASDGRFVVGLSTRGNAGLYVLPPEGPSALVPTRLSGVKRGADVRVTLEVGAVLAGTVVDEAGNSIPRRFIEFAPAQGVSVPDQRVRTDDEGRFRVGGLVPTSYSIRAVTVWSGQAPATLHSVGSPVVGSVTAPNENVRLVALDLGSTPLAFVNSAGDGVGVHFDLRMVDREGRIDAPYVRSQWGKGSFEVRGLPLGVYEVARRDHPAPGNLTVLGTVRCAPPDAASATAAPTTITVPD